MSFKRKILILLLAAMSSLLLSGCILRISADDLYRLPAVSEDYLRLQSHINMILSDGAEFSPPISGPNRHSVQLVDIDGDGVEEVIAFFSIPGDSALKIYIFEMIDGDYSIAEIITGAGTAIESIRYVDLNGDGVLEIIVGWQLGDAIKHIEVYSMHDLNAVLIYGGEYDGITIFDINDDGNDDIIIVRTAAAEIGPIAQAIIMTDNREISSSTISLSAGIENITRVFRGLLRDGVPALFFEGEGNFEEGSFVTDIAAFSRGEFTNVTLNPYSLVSDATVRQRRLHSADLSGDGVIKVPISRRLRSQSDTAYYVVDWYAFDSRGNSDLSVTTYHNPTDEWFLILPPDFRDVVTVRREDVVTGERTVIFSFDDGREKVDILSIFRLTSDAREERARLPGRVRLMAEGTSVFAFELLVPPDSFGLTLNEEMVFENFNLIFSDWFAGTF